jgi:hypothetical protein
MLEWAQGNRFDTYVLRVTPDYLISHSEWLKKSAGHAACVDEYNAKIDRLQLFLCNVNN